jgi:hypothetical protein
MLPMGLNDAFTDEAAPRSEAEAPGCHPGAAHTMHTSNIGGSVTRDGAPRTILLQYHGRKAAAE